MDDLPTSSQAQHARALVGRVLAAWVQDTLVLRRRGWNQPGQAPSPGSARASRFALPAVRPSRNAERRAA